ncbi:uncharacterized protein LOC113941930 isoform X3 [Corapipo altera]|uniref:uncharacterized protein LOC113941930 isoform X3 n=1 Tax=Corapipo altera TaxID=415028 RepID=UPI000FD66ADA|nr:uncharacterized protein LOC113941930 isoform X3 [Corapipo altera]
MHASEFAFQSQSSPAPTVHSPAGFWVARRNQNSVSPNKQTLNSSEEEEAISENASCSISLVGKFHEEYIYAPPDPDCETATVFSSAEPTANLVLVNSAGVSASPDVYTAPATGLSSNSATSTPASVTTATPPQTAVQPVIVSPFSVGRPGRVYRLQPWTKFSVILPSLPSPIQNKC